MRPGPGPAPAAAAGKSSGGPGDLGWLRTALAALLALGLLWLAWSAGSAPEAPGATASGAARTIHLVCLGDSLTYGPSLGRGQAFPARLEALLRERGLLVTVVNGGVSGDTAADGLARLPALLSARPDWVFVCLGANDGLRHQPLEGMRQALVDVVAGIRAAGCRVALGGMRLPHAGDLFYVRDFAAVFPALARELEVPLLPFLLEGVAGEPDLNLPDGMHPNTDGHRIIAKQVADFLEPLLRAG